MFRIILAAALTLVLAACSFSGLKHDPEAVFDNPEAYEASDRYVEMILNRDGDAFLETWTKEVEKQPYLRNQIETVFDELPEGDPLQAKRFFAQLRQGEGKYAGTPVYLSVYDVEGPDGFAQLTLAVYPEDGVCCVTSYVQAIPSTTRPSTFNDLSFEGKGWLHYVMFGLLIGMPLFLVGTAILCFVEKRVRRRWLWIPFILIGLWGVQFNWTTGVLTPELIQIGPGGVQFQIIAIHLLGAQIVTYGPFQPWLLTIGSPVGAIAYLIRRRLAKRADDTAKVYETSF
jgi:hypothetical protein